MAKENLMASRVKSGTVASIAVAATMWLAAGCATMTVRSSAERGADLRQYRTYNWGSPTPRSTGDPRLDNNPFFDERVRGQVDREMALRGFEKSPSEQADLQVHYHVDVSQDVDIRELDSSPSYCLDHDCRPFVYDKGTLFVDFVDPRTGLVVWRGWAEGSLDGVIDNQEWMESRIDEAVVEILRRLPHRPR
jgi:hypothetical protein